MRKLLAVIFAGALASCVFTSQAAEILRLPGSTDLTDVTYWDGGVAPGSGDVALFDSTSFSASTGIVYDADNVYCGGYKFTDLNGPVTFTAITYMYGLGIVVSNTTSDLTFVNIRNNLTTPSAPWIIPSGCTVRTTDISCSNGKSYYTIGISGGGTLIVNGSASGNNSRFMFNVSGTNTTIGGNGTYAPWWSNVGYGMQIGAGAYIAPGDNGVGTMTINDANSGTTALIMADGSGIKFELGTGGSYAAPSGDSDMLSLLNMAAGDVEFQGTTVIDFLGTGTNGVYKLIDTDLDDTTWSGLTVSNQVITGGLTITNLESGLTGAELILGDGTNGTLGDIYLYVPGAAYTPDTLTWAVGDGDWDIDTTANWDDGVGFSVYSQPGGIGDFVTFDDTAAGPSPMTITLNTNVTPSSVIISSTNDYKITGTGSIGGTGTLTKDGSGTATMETANTYSGGTTIAGGEITFTDNSAVGSGTVTFEGGTLQSGGGLNDYMAVNNTLFVDAGQTGTLGLSQRTEVNGALTGSGTLNVTAISTIAREYWDSAGAGFSGTMNISGGGRLDLRANGGAFDGNFSGATVNFDDVTIYTRNWSSGLTVRIGALGGTTNTILSGSGNDAGATTYEVGAKNLSTEFAGVIENGDYNVTKLTKVGTGTLTLSETNTYTGATTVNAGTLYLSGSIVSNVTVASGGAIGGSGTIGNDLTLDDGALFAFNDTSDTLTVSGSLIFNNTNNTFGADDVVVADWGSVGNGTYTLIDGFINTVSGIDSSEYDIGGGRAARLQGSDSLQLVVGGASAVPNISSISVSGGSVVLTWDSGTYNVQANSDLSNSGGWSTVTNAASPVSIPMGAGSQQFYRLSN